MEQLLIYKLLNLFLPPIIFIFLCIITPPYYLFKFTYCTLIKPLFSVEDMRGKSIKNLLDDVAKKARGLGSPDVLVVCADVTKVEDCERFINDAINYFGRLDHLVNNAGISSTCLFKEAKNIPSFAPIMDVNFWGSIYNTYFAIPHLQKSKGRIVVIASVLGWFPGPRLSLYAASKAALMNFYDTLRVELQPDGVKITIASPGVTDSEMTQGKGLSKEGVLQVDKELSDSMIDRFLLGIIPVISSELCAKMVVNGACRGDRSITEPAYYGALHLLNVFFPEFVQWNLAWLNSHRPTNARN
ncbi:hypothetical protein MKX01_016621 [Papaver californicum]|nr:hypothetical protein MKX01_016621 [Papaver californicum]